MSSTSSNSWLALLDEMKQRLHPRPIKLVTAIGSEDAFRNAFEDFGTSHREIETTRLLVRLSFSFENIITFGEAVAGPVPYLESGALTSFVWGVSFALIEVNSLQPLCKSV